MLFIQSLRAEKPLILGSLSEQKCREAFPKRTDRPQLLAIANSWCQFGYCQIVGDCQQENNNKKVIGARLLELWAYKRT